jgi:hypothetical protein
VYLLSSIEALDDDLVEMQCLARLGKKIRNTYIHSLYSKRTDKDANLSD